MICSRTWLTHSTKDGSETTNSKWHVKCHVLRTWQEHLDLTAWNVISRTWHVMMQWYRVLEQYMRSIWVNKCWHHAAFKEYPRWFYEKIDCRILFSLFCLTLEAPGQLGVEWKQKQPKIQWGGWQGDNKGIWKCHHNNPTCVQYLSKYV